MRSRLIGLVSVLFIGSLSIVVPTARFHEQSAPPTKTPFITNLPTKTPFVIEPPTETARPIDPPTKTPFPSATRLPMSTVESTPSPMLTERPTRPSRPIERPSSTSTPASPVVQPISARPGVNNPQPTVTRPSPAPEPTHTPGLESADQSAAVAPVLIAPVTIDLTSLVIAVAGLGLSVWLGLWQHRRALVHSYTTWARADLQLRSETERLAHRDRTVVDDEWVIRLLNQAAWAATSEALGIDQIDRVLLEPVPAIVGLGRHFERVVFTPVPPAAITRLVKRRAWLDLFGDSLRGVRLYAIDALSSDLFVTDDLATAWAYLCDRNHSSPASRLLPRTDRWSIFIVPSQPARPAAGALSRLFTGRR